MLVRWICAGALALACSGCFIDNDRTDAPYEACAPDDGCTQGTACVQTTLPASAGYTGASCTTGCNQDTDCLQDLSNYSAICVNQQCYISCPNGGRSCPYGTGCLTFTDQAGFAVDVCAP